MKAAHTTKNAMTHPYAAFEGTHTWSVVDAAIAELVGNDDLIEQTARPYIVGYLCKALAEKGSNNAN